MNIHDFEGLEIARYRLTMRALEDASLPDFLGSTLRGAFGHSLKQAVCVMTNKACERCMVQDRCLYPYLFETPAPGDSPMLKGQRSAPHPFILTPAWDPSWERTRLAGSSPWERTHPAWPSSSPPDQPWDRPRLAGSSAWERTHPAWPSSSPSARPDPASSPVAQAVPAGISPRLIKRPYATEPDRLPGSPRTFLRKGDPLSFELVLMGRAIDYLPYLVFAVTEMGRRGLGVARKRFELDDVTVLAPHVPDGTSPHGANRAEQSIYSGRTQRIATPANSRATLADWIWERTDLACSPPSERTHPAWPDVVTPAASVPTFQHNPNRGQEEGLDPAPPQPGVSPLRGLGVSPRLGGECLRISFLTPTRIRLDGAPQSAPSFDLLVRSLLRRMSMLFSVHGRGPFQVDYHGLIERASQVEIRSSNLNWFDFERYSNRQQRKMKLGGFVGEITYEAPPEILSEFLPLLVAGEILHIGSGTAFGLGLYRTERPAGRVGRTVTAREDRIPRLSPEPSGELGGTSI